MSAFKDMVNADNSLLLNTNEFAELRTVKYDGETYLDIPVVLRGLKESERKSNASDHTQGLYLVSSVMHCRCSDLGGKQPEKGCKIQINDNEGGGGFFSKFYVVSSKCEYDMLCIELEAIDE